MEPTGGTGSSDAPWKKAALTYFVKQRTLRNQPWPSTPWSGEFHLTPSCTPRTISALGGGVAFPAGLARRGTRVHFALCRCHEPCGEIHPGAGGVLAGRGPGGTLRTRPRNRGAAQRRLSPER